MPSRKNLPKPLIEQALLAYQGGESPTSVARRLGITLHAFKYHVKKAGIWQLGKRLEPIENRFWRFVEKTDDCWNWTGCLFPRGYGCFSIGSQTVSAHRVSYELANGPIPMGLTIDHLCRNKRCVNLDHLEAVTLLVNVRRALPFKKKPANNGEKLTPEQVREIRSLYKPWVCTFEYLASVYGVSRQTIANVINGKNYTHVK